MNLFLIHVFFAITFIPKIYGYNILNYREYLLFD